MLLPDTILLAAVLALAAWRLFVPAWRPRLRIAAAGLAVLLAGGQWILCGFTWQDVPAYILLGLSALPPPKTGAVLRWLGRLGFATIAAACVGVWIMPAVPALPPPDGGYAVGTEIYRWTDFSRDEPHTADPADRRAVIAQVWYPAKQRGPTGGARLPYIDGTGRMPATVSGLPGFLLARYGQIDSHAAPRAPLAGGERPWPVVIFSPGYGAPRAAYTGLATRLASRGFAVFALDHPYEAGVTELPDGRVVGTREIVLPGERDKIPYMIREQARRAADICFVIDRLARPEALSPRLRGRIDGSKVAVIGHSFGGAAAIAALGEDSRVVAAANIDGTPYGDLTARKLARPFLLIESDPAETPHGDQFVEGNGRLLANMSAPGFRYEIGHANHYSFTDLPFFFAPPGRWLLAQAIGGERGPAETQQATADLLAAFLAGPLTGKAADLAATAARYRDIRGGRVSPRRQSG
ncbi:MAG: alpha/beta fold hydrolase [Novosphingobium sp.]|nr:alpha/beta fold hydrolase [Novosphingobium sp.]MBO9602985.1 alpha/beta fold hydrolase [Novosphingobium sp.]